MKISISSGKKCSFYIARVGRCVGKPMKTAYTSTNCFDVISDQPDLDFAKCYCLYVSGAFDYYSHGSCQQTITVKDAREATKLISRITEQQAQKVTAFLNMAEALQNEANKAKELARALALNSIH